MNVYLDQERGNETKRAIEALREQRCGFVDDIFVVDDKDVEAVRPSLPQLRKLKRFINVNMGIDIRRQRRQNSLLVYSRLNMALQIYHGAFTRCLEGRRG